MDDQEFDVDTLFTPITPLHALTRLKRPSEKTKRGYRLDRFPTPPRPDFQCRVCGGVVRDPRECVECGLLICAECVDDELSAPRRRSGFYFMYRAREHHCPGCDTNCATRDPSRLLKRLILSLQVYCKHREAGCQAVTILSEAQGHQRVCPFKYIHCGNAACCQRTGRREDFCMVKTDIRDSERLFACSEICRKTILLDNLLRRGEMEKAIEEYYSAAKQLGTSSQALPSA